MAYVIKDPDAPMTYKQGIMIRNGGGGDVRPENLTKQQASDRIGQLLKQRGMASTQDVDLDDLFRQAELAGIAAGRGVSPTPMLIEGYDPIEGGVCGFAWVNFKMKNRITRKFGRFLKDNGLGRKDEYYGGVTISISDHGQSMTRKEAHASAMAKVLREAGIEAYSASRMD